MGLGIRDIADWFYCVMFLCFYIYIYICTCLIFIIISCIIHIYCLCCVVTYLISSGKLRNGLESTVCLR